VVRDDAAVDEVQRAEVRLRVGASEVVVVPRPRLDDATREPARTPPIGDALGERVDHRLTPCVLRVEHLMDADEVRTDDVPVDVLERESEIDERAQPLLQTVATRSPSSDDTPGAVNDAWRSGGSRAPPNPLARWSASRSCSSTLLVLDRDSPAGATDGRLALQASARRVLVSRGRRS
jgi:hypothetical protein